MGFWLNASNKRLTQAQDIFMFYSTTLNTSIISHTILKFLRVLNKVVVSSWLNGTAQFLGSSERLLSDKSKDIIQKCYFCLYK